MDSPLKYFQENIFSYFLKEFSRSKDARTDIKTIIKFHKDGSKDVGDLSFTFNKDVWAKYFGQQNIKISSEFVEMHNEKSNCNVGKHEIDFLHFASHWVYPVRNVKLSSERCYLFFDRIAISYSVIKQVIQNTDNFGKLRKNPTRIVKLVNADMFDDNCIDLSKYRVLLIARVLKNILRFSNCIECSEIQKTSLNVCVQSVAEQITNKETKNSEKTVIIKCGLVVDPKTNKKSTIRTQEYQELRSNELHLIAIHKYGIRVKEDDDFKESINILGKSAVKVDLLEKKHSSPVYTILNGQGSTKGASFILYNSARLESLLRAFNERIATKVYDKLPDIDEVNFSLLKEDLEWQLVYRYILEFPNLIDRCLKKLEEGIVCNHLITSYLSSFVSVFSCYYRRTRILTEYREHLMPYVYARIYLIKATREVLNLTMGLIEVSPVFSM